MNLEEVIREFFVGELGLDLSTVTNSDLLFSNGVVDSFALIELLAFLEDELGAQISIAELTMVNIDSIDAITSLVGRAVAE
ncbi:MAG: acyl carrier protein [Alphaproteobacteria bacterium]|nr:acyl carrier protein [Alphaproteobacteria bacterium]